MKHRLAAWIIVNDWYGTVPEPMMLSTACIVDLVDRIEQALEGAEKGSSCPQEA